jgi:glutathione S-transferase
VYKVIGPLRTRAFRVVWMLNELGQSFTVDPVPPRDASIKSLNPSGKVPILLDGSDAIIDSVAICQYLADKHGQCTFRAGTIERAHQDSFTQFAADDVESCLWTVSKHTFVLPEELRVPAVKEACRYDFDRAIQSLAKRLGSKNYVMGDTFTVADLLLGHCGGWAESIGWTVNDTTVANYISRVRMRPAFLKTIASRKQA